MEALLSLELVDVVMNLKREKIKTFIDALRYQLQLTLCYDFNGFPFSGSNVSQNEFNGH